MATKVCYLVPGGATIACTMTVINGIVDYCTVCSRKVSASAFFYFSNLSAISSIRIILCYIRE